MSLRLWGATPQRIFSVSRIFILFKHLTLFEVTYYD